MGLVRRRHFATRGRELLAIEDELFGESSGLLGGELSIVDEGREIRGQSTLIAALEEVRTGRLGDIVATIQGEQDECIRSDLPCRRVSSAEHRVRYEWGSKVQSR